MTASKYIVSLVVIVLTILPSAARAQIAWIVNNSYSTLVLYEDSNCGGSELETYDGPGYPTQVFGVAQSAQSVYVEDGWCTNVPTENQEETSTVSVDLGGTVDFLLSSEDDPYEMAPDVSNDGIPDNLIPITEVEAPGPDITVTGQACPTTITGYPSGMTYRLNGAPYQQHEYSYFSKSGGATVSLSYIMGALDPSLRASLQAAGYRIVDVTYWMASYVRDGDNAVRTLNCSTMHFVS
jgi:hypothetical protein